MEMLTAKASSPKGRGDFLTSTKQPCPAAFRIGAAEQGQWAAMRPGLTSTAFATRVSRCGGAGKSARSVRRDNYVVTMRRAPDRRIVPVRQASGPLRPVLPRRSTIHRRSIRRHHSNRRRRTIHSTDQTTFGRGSTGSRQPVDNRSSLRRPGMHSSARRSRPAWRAVGSTSAGLA
jgi:hypothetical protein